MSLLDDMATRLVNETVGTIGASIFQGRVPTMPNELVALFEVPGTAPRRTMGGQRTVDQPNVHVIVRSTTYDLGRAKALAAYNALDGFAGTLNSNRYLFVDAVSNIHHNGPDEQGRHQFSFTVRVKVAP